jgi:hypothetical protein
MDSSSGASVVVAGLHPSVLNSIERLRLRQYPHHHHGPDSTKTKHRLALWDVRPLDRKNAQYVVDFLQEQQQDDDVEHAVIVSQLVLAYCDLSLEAVQVLSSHFEQSTKTHLENVTLSHLRGLGDGGMNGTTVAAGASSSPLHRLLTALSNNSSVTELCLDNVLLLPVQAAAAAPRGNNNNTNDHDNNNALGQLLQSNRHITKLSCSTTRLGLPGMLGLQAGFFYNDTLQELDLNDVHLGNAGLEALVRALVGRRQCTTANANTTSTASTTSTSTSTIIHQCSMSRIKVLSLAQNQISWGGLPSLARLLQQSKYLKSLILRLNRGILDTSRDDDDDAGVVGDGGAAAAVWRQAQGQAQPLSAHACRQVFCKALRDNKTLVLLSLSDCSVRGTSAAMIVQALAAPAAAAGKHQQHRSNASNAHRGNATLQTLELDGFRLDSDVHVCRTWQACLPRIAGLRHLSIHLDFGRNAALLSALHKNPSLESISRQPRRDCHGKSSSSNSSGGHRRLARSNSIGSEGSSSSSASAAAAADSAVYSVLERNRLARLARESFGFPPPLSPPTITAAGALLDSGTTRSTNTITPGILYQGILRVTSTANAAATSDDDGDAENEDGASVVTPVMSTGGMAHVLYQILRPRIDIVVSQQLQQRHGN